MDFSSHVESVEGERALIALAGEVDLYNAPEFKAQLLDAIGGGAKHVVVDLSDVTFLDSTTLGVLVGGIKRVRPDGGTMTLVIDNEQINQIFEITGLNRVFPIFQTRGEALATLQ
jgi:anti-sigma B factor antagonist